MDAHSAAEAEAAVGRRVRRELRKPARAGARKKRAERCREDERERRAALRQRGTGFGVV